MYHLDCILHHLAEDGGQVGVVLLRDLIEDAEHGKSIRHSKVVRRWGTIHVVLGVDVDQVDLDGILLPVHRVLRTFRTIRAPVPMQLQKVKSDKWGKFDLQRTYNEDLAVPTPSGANNSPKFLNKKPQGLSPDNKTDTT